MRHVLLLAFVLACSGAPAPRAPEPAAAPRLVVLVVIDQLPLWAWPAKVDAAEAGIARIVRDGRSWRARYPFAATQTAAGHAALGTGAPPSVTGIVGNEWWDRVAGREIKATEGTAERLRVDGIGDALLAARPDARAVAVALKERSALLTLGHRGLAVWYDDTCTCFVAGGGAAPAWLDDLAKDHPIAPRLAEPWVPTDPARLETLSGVPDDSPGEVAIPGWGATFPHRLTDTPNPAKSLIDTPLGDAIVAEAAIAAIRGEALGADDAADLLIVSFGAHDYVGHAFGPESWESWDAWLRLDVAIGGLVEILDAEVGAGRWAMVLTGDHGAPKLPERYDRHDGAARISFGDIEAAAERAAGGDVVLSARIPYLYLRDGADVPAIVAALRELPYLARVEAVADLRCDGDDATRAICLSIDRERSGEIVYQPAYGTTIHKPDWIDGVAHGSIHDYDREVPIVVVAPGVAAGADDAWVSPLQVAPTLADLLGIPPPAAAAERSLRARR